MVSPVFQLTVRAAVPHMLTSGTAKCAVVGARCRGTKMHVRVRMSRLRTCCKPGYDIVHELTLQLLHTHWVDNNGVKTKLRQLHILPCSHFDAQ